MKTEKAKQLNLYLKTAITFFESTVEKKENELPNYIRIKNSLTEETFKKNYDNFISEMKENILEYRDYDTAADYLKMYLVDFKEWEGFGYSINNKIIKNNYEVQFLLKLKLSIENYIQKIRYLLLDYFLYDSNFRKFYNNTISEDNINTREQNKPQIDTNKPAFDERFDFDKMMTECASKAQDTLSRVGFIQDRLFDFRQWQIKYDVEDNTRAMFDRSNCKLKYTTEYYPKFEQQCKLELERLEKKHEIDKKKLTNKAIEKNPIIIQNIVESPYKWNSSDTDFLELFAALYQNQSIARTDGKPLTRKEMQEYFQNIMSLNIKDVEGKLTKATNRKLNMTPFIDSIKAAFETYAKDKEDRLESRR